MRNLVGEFLWGGACEVNNHKMMACEAVMIVCSKAARNTQTTTKKCFVASSISSI